MSLTCCGLPTAPLLQVCDQPHPLVVTSIVRSCLEGDVDAACAGMKHLFGLGYAGSDIISTLFRITKNYDMPEYLKLHFIRVWGSPHLNADPHSSSWTPSCSPVCWLLFLSL